MILPNNRASELLGKDKNKAAKAAEHIINTPDIEAWKCLIDNADYLFGYIKEKAGKFLAKAINKDNIEKVFSLFSYHSYDWDGYLVQALSDYSDENLNIKFLELLKTGTDQEKAYAAKYFCFVDDKNAASVLFDTAKSDFQPLKINSAEALGNLKDEFSYNYFIGKLQSLDDWDKIEAAQFLANYGNKNAAVPMLKAMSESGMKEHIAGEIAGFINLFEFFENPDMEIQLLTLEAFDNILSGMAEIWPLTVLIDFKIYECIDKLIEITNKNPDSLLSGKYAQLLLKARTKVILFVENSQYTFDEEKAILNELEEIYHLLVSENEEFWNKQYENINKELMEADSKRKISAISIINELELKDSVPYLIKLLSNVSESEMIICESIMTLAKMNHLNDISNMNEVLSRVENQNIAAIIKSALDITK